MPVATPIWRGPQSREQLVLELEPERRLAPVGRSAQGLVEALADLLFEALEMDNEKNGAPDRIKLGTRMLLFVLYNL
jgi:hypothetical protein